MQIIIRCQGNKIVLYQSGRHIERAKIPVGYFATSSVERFFVHPKIPDVYVVFFEELSPIQSPKRISAKGFSEDPALRSETDAFKGWRAAQQVREITAKTFSRLTGEAKGDDEPQVFAPDELVLPQFTRHQRRIRDPNFHNRVYRAYGGRCAISGITLLANGTCGLVAAHIFPHADTAYNFVGAGILLAPTWHDRFDRGMIIIEDDYGWKAIVEDQDTEAMQDRKLLLPLNESDWPNVDLLRRKRKIVGFS